jgi:hypothetical protein
MTVTRSPLHPLLDEINKAAAGGLPFLALTMTVCLPDICASLSAPNGGTTGDAYKRWCEQNLGDEFSYLTPEDLYSMRCGILHNGRFGGMKHNVARVIFFLPGNVSLTNGVIDDAYLYSVVDFCRNFTDSVAVWLENNKSDKTIQDNLQKLMQYRIGGLLPYISGITVLA